VTAKADKAQKIGKRHGAQNQVQVTDRDNERIADGWTGRTVTPEAAIRMDSTADTDAALIQLSQTKPEVFASVFDRHADRIYRYVAARVGPDIADDVTAETFLAAFRGRDRYDAGRDDARPWLYGIATRLISSHRRAEQRRARLLARIPLPGLTEGFEDAANDRVSAERTLAQLGAVIADLTAADRELLLLVAWTDLSHADVAEALGIAAGTVASRLHRIRKKISRTTSHVSHRAR
jgi:RNA polymerase sigma factor (sigma-70 family)